jgi:PAS domain S-box-containing protein
LTDTLVTNRTSPVSPPSDFEEIINSIPALVARLDCNLQIVYGNSNFFRWFPRSGEASHFFQVVVGKSTFFQIQRHLGAVLSGRKAHFTISVEHKESIYYLDVNLSPQFDREGRVDSIIFHSTDVTEKLNDQRALRDYFDNATIGLHWVNAEGIIIWANPAELELLGYASDEYIGHPIAKFHKSQRSIQDILSRLSNHEVLRNYEAEMICKDGSTRYVSINSSVLWDGQDFIHTRCFTVDITAQKLADLALQETEQRFKIMADLVPLIMLTTDENGQCTFLNVKWKEYTGRAVHDGFGNGWLNLIHPDDRPKIISSWNQSLVKRNSFEAKFRLLSNTGSYFVCCVHLLPRIDQSDTFIGHIGIIQDVSGQEQLTATLEKMVRDRTNDLRMKNLELSNAEKTLKIKNEELEQTNHDLLSFAHVASHDLQEPLRKIQTYIDRIVHSEGAVLSDKGRIYIGKVQNAAERMRGLIQDILSYSKTTGVESKLELVDLNQLVKDVVTEFEIKIEETKASIDFKDLPSVTVTRFQFHQVFLNLISNALKFRKKDAPPQIRIRSTLVEGCDVGIRQGAGSFYRITFSDNGIGFEPGYGNEIFEMFSRLHDHQFEGTGIGLAVCKKIVERHHGSMLAEGRPGEGSTFYIFLPAEPLTLYKND